VQNPAKSKYGNNPDVEVMKGKERADCQNAIRQRRFLARKAAEKDELIAKVAQQEKSMKKYV
jgi:hypothetical protein